MNYQQTAICPVCLSLTSITVNAHGDYDGPDEMRESNPAMCPTCSGIKLVNPEFHALLERHYARTKAIRLKAEKGIQYLRSTLLSPSEMWHPIMGPFAGQKFLERFHKYLKSSARIAKTTPEDPGEWAMEHAIIDTIKDAYRETEKHHKDNQKP